MTLGALAIEQLTGAIVAKQVLLSGETNASASANIANTQAQLERAQKIEADKKVTLDTATDAQKKQQELVDQTQKALDDEQAKPSDKQDKEVLKKLQADLKGQTDDLAKKKAAVDVAQTAYKKAQEVTQAIQQNLNAAITSGTAVAKTTATASGDGNQSTIDDHTVEAIADATKAIVIEIIRKGHATDTCLNFMTAIASQGTQNMTAATAQVYKQCEEIMRIYLEAYAKAMAAGTSAPSPAAARVSPPPPTAPAPPPPPPAIR